MRNSISLAVLAVTVGIAAYASAQVSPKGGHEWDVERTSYGYELSYSRRNISYDVGSNPSHNYWAQLDLSFQCRNSDHAYLSSWLSEDARESGFEQFGQMRIDASWRLSPHSAIRIDGRTIRDQRLVMDVAARIYTNAVGNRRYTKSDGSPEDRNTASVWLFSDRSASFPAYLVSIPSYGFDDAWDDFKAKCKGLPSNSASSVGAPRDAEAVPFLEGH